MYSCRLRTGVLDEAVSTVLDRGSEKSTGSEASEGTRGAGQPHTHKVLNSLTNSQSYLTITFVFILLASLRGFVYPDPNLCDWSQ